MKPSDLEEKHPGMVLENPDELTKEQIDNVTAFFLCFLSHPSFKPGRLSFAS
ncbi:MAG: hypothetical protein KC652_19200 [Cyanobacteria bacterium HKST-UBA01]|nr:hypothetical protein [Cyanobacteria bacterium HKST-UBA01]